MPSSYLISGGSVFYTFTSSLWADPESFQQVGKKGPVAVDKERAFWGTYQFDADPTSLVCLLPGLLYKDRQAVYAYGSKLGRTHAASFKLLDHPHPCLALAADDQQRFIFESLTGGFMTQPESMGRNAAKLKKVLSITRVPVEGDERRWIEQVSQSFAPAGPPPQDKETAMIVQDGECRLQTRQGVPGDPASFEAITDRAGRDKHHFFWDAQIVPEVHSASVEHIWDFFFKDRNHVFCLLYGRYTPVLKADPRSFRFVEGAFYPAYYAVDDQAGFCLMYGAHRLKVKRFVLPDPTALRVVKSEPDSEGRVELGLATDGTTLFKDGVPIESIPRP